MSEATKLYEDKMNKTINNLNEEYITIRAGRANPHILDKIKVDYYGQPSPLQSVANISVPEARIIQIQPWEASLIKAIEKEINIANLGVVPNNDGKSIRLVFPELTEERRKEIVKTASTKVEEAKVALRKVRDDARKELKAADDLSEDVKKRGEKEIDDLIKKFSNKIDELFKIKESEIMKI